MGTTIRGTVRAGKNDASRWLRLFNEAYSRKTGMAIYPGSLNLRLEQPFDWFEAVRQPHVVRFNRAEYGGERDILLMPCVLRSLGNRRAWLWSTENAARDPADRHVVEIITDVRLRDAYGLNDGDHVDVELPA